MKIKLDVKFWKRYALMLVIYFLIAALFFLAGMVAGIILILER